MKMKELMIIAFILTGLTSNAQIDPFKLEGKKPAPLEDIERALEYNLDHIKIEDSDYYRIYTYPGQNHYYYNYFTERARERMVELLEGKWTEEEIQSRINLDYEKDTLNPRNEFYKDAKRMAKQDSLPLNRVWDSMLKTRIQEDRQIILNSEYVPAQIISIAGFLKDSRFLPYLLKMGEGDYVSDDIELGLARYGIEPYHTNAVKKYAYTPKNWNADVSKLMYICSKEAIEEIYNYIMKEDGQICDSQGNCLGYLAVLEMGAFVRLFKSDELRKEMEALDAEYYQNGKEIDESYLKDMRKVAKKYYRRFKEQEPDCEDVPVDAW